MAEFNSITDKRHPLLLHCPSCLEDVTIVKDTDSEKIFSCPKCMACLKIVEVAGVRAVVITYDQTNVNANDKKTFQFEAGEESPADPV